MALQTYERALIAAFCMAVVAVIAILFAWPSVEPDRAQLAMLAPIAVAAEAEGLASGSDRSSKESATMTDRRDSAESGVAGGLAALIPNTPPAPPLQLTDSLESVPAGADEVVTSEPEVVANADEVVTSEPEVVPNADEVVTSEPEVVANADEVVTSESEVVANADEVVTSEPEVVPNADEVVTSEPEVMANAGEPMPAGPEVVGEVDEPVSPDLGAHYVVAPEPATEVASPEEAEQAQVEVAANTEPAAPVPAPPGYTTVGEAALSQVRFDLSSIGYTISFHPPNRSFRGLTFTRRRHIEVYVRPHMSATDVAYVIAHEMGHAVDHIRNDSADRAAWRSARGMARNVRWWPNGTENDFASPAGDFAECFANWSVGAPSHSAWGSCDGVNSLMGRLAAA